MTRQLVVFVCFLRAIFASWRFPAILAAALMMAGCHNFQRLNPPSRPTPDQIANDEFPGVAARMKFIQASGASDGNLRAATYIKMGYHIIDEQCDTFFNYLANASRGYDFLHKETILGIATTSNILNLLHNSAQTLALVAASGAFISQTVDYTEDFVLLTRYTGQLKFLVDQARKAYKDENTPDKAGDDIFVADDYVRNYANICTVSGLEDIIGRSINNSQAVAGDYGSQYVSSVAFFISGDLGVVPTTAQLRELVALLSSANDADRSAASTGAKATAMGKAANGKYWRDKATANEPVGHLLRLGSDRLRFISMALATLPPPTGAVSAGTPPASGAAPVVEVLPSRMDAMLFEGQPRPSAPVAARPPVPVLIVPKGR